MAVRGGSVTRTDASEYVVNTVVTSFFSCLPTFAIVRKRIHPILKRAIDDWRLDKGESFWNGRQGERRFEIYNAYVEFLELVPPEDGPYPTHFELITMSAVDELVKRKTLHCPLRRSAGIRSTNSWANSNRLRGTR